MGPGTLGEVWTRHFADSAQLLPYLVPGAARLYDLGSGAGFPGMVLAMLRPDLDVHLVEADERKAMFLRTVSRETATPVTVHGQRIEALPADAAPDMVTARALAALPQILAWCTPWAERNPGLVLLLPKGEKATLEIEAARERYSFLSESYTSTTAPDARILRLSRLACKA